MSISEKKRYADECEMAPARETLVMRVEQLEKQLSALREEFFELRTVQEEHSASLSRLDREVGI